MDECIYCCWYCQMFFRKISIYKNFKDLVFELIYLDHKILEYGYISGKAQVQRSLYTFYCEAPSKYIVVRKFMKKQCVAAPVAKKLAIKVWSTFHGASFSMESSSSFFLSYIFQRRKRQGWLLNFFLVLFWFFSELFDNIVFEYIYIWISAMVFYHQ